MSVSTYKSNTPEYGKSNADETDRFRIGTMKPHLGRKIKPLEGFFGHVGERVQNAKPISTAEFGCKKYVDEA
ncbi:hypothetical protein TNIN_208291 [Trichonephila inaurata madagascariensis]|uniref:Uncharacterized protein n=1 Tax=Trichonephila inaurata madagascariensis TaxID=2747483 RepID=A0A8X7CL51_9ARAC|nr:hypothetical protein TNIN_208291 [Trichonephila inaurata madagascariensis]